MHSTLDIRDRKLLQKILQNVLKTRIYYFNFVSKLFNITYFEGRKHFVIIFAQGVRTVSFHINFFSESQRMEESKGIS